MLALHNINYFHWHLTEDQGWRIEIKKYPRLTEVGSYRKETITAPGSKEYDGVPVSGYYTQEEAKEIVRYAPIVLLLLFRRLICRDTCWRLWLLIRSWDVRGDRMRWLPVSVCWKMCCAGGIRKRSSLRKMCWRRLWMFPFGVYSYRWG